MTHSLPVRVRPLLAGACALATALAAAAQSHRTAAPLAIANARLAPGREPVTLVVRDGRIHSILAAGTTVPIDAHSIDAQGLLVLPPFVDAYTMTGCALRTPDADRDLPTDTGANVDIDMREANRKGVQPAYRAANVAELRGEQRLAWRKSGFGHALVAPHGQILCGTSALLSLRDAATRDAVVAANVFQQAGFSATGPGYPSTAMGYVAQLRQLFLDARRHAELRERYDHGRPGTRPAWDEDLDAFQPVLNGAQRIAARADRANEIDRWLDLSEELGFQLVIVGGREAFRHARRLSARGVPVVLTLDWGEEVEAPKPVESGGERPRYDEPLEVRREKRRKWEELRGGALVLHEAGVRLAFGSADAAPGELFARVRKLVELGFPIDVARAALGPVGASVLGAERRIGSIDVGKDAGVALWTADPLDPASKGARLRWLVLDGWSEEFPLSDGLEGPPAPGVDLAGSWTLALVADSSGPKLGEATFEMELDGALKGTLMLRDGADAPAKGGEVKGKVGGKQARISGRLGAAPTDPEWTITLRLKEGGWSGEFEVRLESGAYKATVKFAKVPEHDEELYR
jgi:imidazolonepropionase-like amidohydrolase